MEACGQDGRGPTRAVAPTRRRERINTLLTYRMTTHNDVETHSVDARHRYNAIIHRYKNEVVLCRL
jgi:hypothetical protein